MNRIVATAAVQEFLASLGDATEIVNAQGGVLGRFVPAAPPTDNDCPYTEEELERMYRSQGAKSTEEVKKSIGMR